MRPFLLRTGLLALVACIAPLVPAEAQTTGATVREKATVGPVAVPRAATPSAMVRQNPVPVGKSVSARVFDVDWVVFPARLAIVIVLLTISLCLLMTGTWGMVRVAHSLRHMKWSQPPRRLKRGELGAAGTSFALEFEERIHENLQQDAERDQQLASLSEIVARLSKDQNAMAATVAAMLTTSRNEVPGGPANEG